MPGTAEGQPDPNPCWVSALASLRHTDLFASGSSDGFIRLWKIDKDMRGFRRVAVIPVKGVVNALAFFEGPDWDAPEEAAKPTPANRRDRARGIGLGGPTEAYVYLAAAVGDEHRLGRWFSVPARNRVVVVKLGKKKD